MICEITPAALGLLLSITLLLLFAEIFCVIFLFLLHRDRRKTLCSCILLFCTFVLFELQESVAEKEPIPHIPDFGRQRTALPVLFLLLFSGLTLWELFSVFRWRKEQFSPDTIRESINQLPTGLCFGAKNGSVLLANHVMEEISLSATGEALLDANAFWEAAGKSGFLTLEDGTVWSLDRRVLPTELGDVYQITATDVTKTHALMQELKREQQHLKEVNKRLLQYGDSVAVLTREKEILSARIRVHDSLGECLLAAKRCILTPVDRRDKEEALRLWQQAITLMETPQEEEKSDSLGELLKAARAVGVGVVFQGAVPPAGTAARTLTEAAIHTCVTNTVRHAKGTRLFVLLERTGTLWTIRCTNNGAAPSGPIREGGGLSSLRRQVEREGGTMTVESTPRFVLTILTEEGGLS